MKKLLLIITFILLISSLFSYNIDYQIHSNDDLNELSSLLIKGARSFKFDPHYIKNHKLCNDENIGCLLLIHDKPSIFSSNYNTTDELLTYLSTSSLLSSIINNNEKIKIALCFKSAPDKCNYNSNDFINWLNLVNDFYNKIITTQQLNNIEFVLDGDGKPIDCLKGKFPLLNSVWINTDSPSEAFYSNDVVNDYNRFQILNDPDNLQNWTWKASPSINYGIFIIIIILKIIIIIIIILKESLII